MEKDEVKFWSGEFGDSYTERNQGEQFISSNTALFTSALKKASGIESILEIGCNRGLNLKALKHLLPEATLTGIDVNVNALEEVKKWGEATVLNCPVEQYDSDQMYDLVFTKGVLIHISPKNLSTAYEKLFKFSKSYLLVAEYFSPTPQEVEYRGHAGKLFKRDFAGELLKLYPNLSLLDYGFCYRLDPIFPQDNITWFLLEKQ